MVGLALLLALSVGFAGACGGSGVDPSASSGDAVEGADAGETDEGADAGETGENADSGENAESSDEVQPPPPPPNAPGEAGEGLAGESTGGSDEVQPPPPPPNAPPQSGESVPEVIGEEVLLDPQATPEGGVADVFPAQEIDQGVGSANLFIDRSFTLPYDSYLSMATDITLILGYEALSEPWEPAVISGYTVGEFDFLAAGRGISGGGHDTTGNGPVRYEIDGTFYPVPLCTWEITVTETVLWSEVTSVYNTFLGEMPTPGFADMSVTMTVEFDEQILYDFIIGPAENVSFVLNDIVLPPGTGCAFPTN